MTGAQQSIASATDEVQRLRKALCKTKTKQVWSDDGHQVIKATAHTWFNSHRKVISLVFDDAQLRDLDNEYKWLLAAGDRAPGRSKCLKNLKRITNLLTGLQANYAITLAADAPQRHTSTVDTPPNFTPLIGDIRMQAVLARRWEECAKCVEAGAPLAATVMMGGILEGLLLARVNQLSDKSPVFRAKSAPKDKTEIPLKLSGWTLKNYMDVAHELGWISRTTRDVGEVVRDYRNYVHPQKEYSHGITISTDDARMLWEVAKSVARQVLKPLRGSAADAGG